MNKLDWFLSAKYGAIVHWGLYAIPGGYWQGEYAPHGGEWIMKNWRSGIPYADYAALADQFNPVEFDADAFVYFLKEDCGFRYLVFTAKHHDGFAMYDSACNDYNIMHTPYGKDVTRALADACEKYGLTFCLYYSQLQDWADPNGFGNTWDFGPEKGKDFRKYLEEKCKPQLKELLTEYGKIGLIWFDTPYEMDKTQCQELVDYVHQFQPDCLINGRVGYNLGDYRQMGDRGIPLCTYRKPWEVPMTLNDTWGYRSDDERWKTPERVIRLMAEVAGKGGNLLLNIGPDALGNIPAESESILKTVGNWMKKNGESIYDTDPMPDFPYRLDTDFGCFTYSRNRKKLYMHIFNYPAVPPHQICVVGLETKAGKAYLLETGEEIMCWQTYETARDEHRLRVRLPYDQAPNTLDTVVVIELEEDDLRTQQL